MTTEQTNKIEITTIGKIPKPDLEARMQPTTPKKPTSKQKTALLRERVYLKYHGHCAYCGCKITPDTFQVDHIVPRARYAKIHPNGNVNAFTNLNPSCRSCNKYKDVYLLDELRHEIGQQIERLRRLSTFNLAERYGLIHCTPKKVKFYFEKTKAKQ